MTINFKIKAIEISQTIDFRGIFEKMKKEFSVAWTDPLMLALNAHNMEYLIITRYGVIALTNATPALEKRVLSFLKPFLKKPFASRTNYDEVEIIIDSSQPMKVNFDNIMLPSSQGKSMLIIGMILAQSVGLESYEKRVDPLLNHLSKEISKFENITAFLQTRGFTKNIIKIMRLEQELVSNLEIFDKPELAWNDADLDLLYTRYVEHLEIADRAKILSEKFKLLQNNIKTAFDMVNAQRANLLEFAIVALFILDILLFFFKE